MPSGVADYGCTLWLEVMFGVRPAPTDYWVALCSDEPGKGSDGTIVATLEPNPTLGYQRQHIGAGAANWATNGTFLASLVDLDWPLAFADWGRITHYALLDAQVGGNLFGWGEINNPQYVSTGFMFSIPAGGLLIDMSSLVNPIVY